MSLRKAACVFSGACDIIMTSDYSYSVCHGRFSYLRRRRERFPKKGMKEILLSLQKQTAIQTFCLLPVSTMQNIDGNDEETVSDAPSEE